MGFSSHLNIAERTVTSSMHIQNKYTKVEITKAFYRDASVILREIQHSGNASNSKVAYIPRKILGKATHRKSNSFVAVIFSEKMQLDRDTSEEIYHAVKWLNHYPLKSINY